MSNSIFEQPQYDTDLDYIKFWGISVIICFICVLLLIALFSIKPDAKAVIPIPVKSIPIKVYFDYGNKHVTYYHAKGGQTDDSPNVGANGRVAINGNPTGFWFASNELPFGTKIVIPTLTGDTVWTCKDRMSSRLPHYIDLLVPSHVKLKSGKYKVQLVKMTMVTVNVGTN